MAELYQLVKALVIGIIVGMFFTALRVEIPGPDNLAAIVGILGLFIGLLIVTNMNWYLM